MDSIYQSICGGKTQRRCEIGNITSLEIDLQRLLVSHTISNLQQSYICACLISYKMGIAIYITTSLCICGKSNSTRISPRALLGSKCSWLSVLTTPWIKQCKHTSKTNNLRRKAYGFGTRAYVGWNLCFFQWPHFVIHGC